MSAPAEVAPGARLRLQPNRHTAGLGAVILAMVYAGASQNNAAAYLLGFLLFSLALVSALHAWRNLCGLRLSVEPPPPVFAGEPVPLRFTLRAEGRARPTALRVSTPGGTAAEVPRVNAGEGARGEILLPTTGRGRFPGVPLQVESTFPLGFLTARREATVIQAYYVYPRPEGDLPLTPELRSGSASPTGTQPEGDDFAGVRDWRQGESMRHIDWKAAARSERLLVKQWSGTGTERLRLDWALLPPEMEVEARLRQLSRWVVQAARLETAWELLLPGQPPLGPARGEAHLHECLRALARFVTPRPSAPGTAVRA